MLGANNSEYYRRRAEQASALARAAIKPEVQAIHRDMAARYTALAEAGQQQVQRPTLKLAF